MQIAKAFDKANSIIDDLTQKLVDNVDGEIYRQVLRKESLQACLDLLLIEGQFNKTRKTSKKLNKE